MPIQFCNICDRLIDLDNDVEHFQMHEEELKNEEDK